MRNIFEVTTEEKERILNLHENATKNQYLTEQEGQKGMMGPERDIEFPTSPIFPDEYKNYVSFQFLGQGDHTTLSFNSKGEEGGTIITITPNQEDNDEVVKQFINTHLQSVMEYKNHYFPNSNSFYFPDFKVNPLNNRIDFFWLVVTVGEQKKGRNQLNIKNIIRNSQPTKSFN